MSQPIMKRAARGIYAGKHIQFGNNVSYSKRHTRRSFKPNVHSKRIESETLDKMFKLRVTTHAMRSIDKFGGLDPWLLNSKFVEDSDVAKKLRKQVLGALNRDPETFDPTKPSLPLPEKIKRMPRNREEEARRAKVAEAAAAKARKRAEEEKLKKEQEAAAKKLEPEAAAKAAAAAEASPPVSPPAAASS